MTPTQKFLKEKSDFRELLRGLDVDETDVVTAAKTQAGLYLKTARYRVQKMRARVKAESRLDGLRSEKALIIRRRNQEKKIKMTESNVKELLLKNPQIQAAMAELEQTIEEEELGKRLLDAYDHRGKAIRVVADLIGYETTVERKMGDYQALADLKAKLKTKYPAEEP